MYVQQTPEQVISEKLIFFQPADFSSLFGKRKKKKVKNP